MVNKGHFKKDMIPSTSLSSRKVLFTTTNISGQSTPDSSQADVKSYGVGQNGTAKANTPLSSEETTCLVDGTSMEKGALEIDALGDPPEDRFNLVYIIFLINGISTLMPWNMFITAQSYFVDYKLGGPKEEYSKNFSSYLGICSQVPNLLLNLINAFASSGGSLSCRIIGSLSILILMLVVTIILAIVDSSTWPLGFFIITMITAIICNGAVGVYQNCVYGMAANFPMRYTSSVMLGSNISGTFTSVVSLVSMMLAPEPKTAAIYYFTTALVVCLISFDSYFILPHCQYYKYHKRLHRVHSSEVNMKMGDSLASYIAPYVTVFKKVWIQMFNIFFIFFVSLSIFPAIQVAVEPVHENFFFAGKYFTSVTCFLAFNFFAMLGNMVPSWIRNPGPKYLWIPIVLRGLMIPFFMLSNYRPLCRSWPVLFTSDWLYTLMSCVNGFTSGYFATLVMMYTPKMVGKGYERITAMLATFFLILGIVCGINNTLLLSYVNEHLGPLPQHSNSTCLSAH